MTFLLLLFLPFLLVQLRRTSTYTGQVKFLQQNTIAINLLRKVEELDFWTSLRSNPRLKELITSFRNPCDPFEFGYTCKLTLGDWATIVFIFVLFARNHTSKHTIPMTEDTLLPSKTEVLLLIKQKVSHKVEDANGDLWYAPAIFMLRGRSRHWEETVCPWASHWSSGYMSLCCQTHCMHSGEGCGLDTAAHWDSFTLWNWYFRKQGLPGKRLTRAQ